MSSLVVESIGIFCSSSQENEKKKISRIPYMVICFIFSYIVLKTISFDLYTNTHTHTHSYNFYHSVRDIKKNFNSIIIIIVYLKKKQIHYKF